MEAPGTAQQIIKNTYNGPVTVLGDRANIGGIANQGNEENKGAEASSSSVDMKLYYSTTLCKASPLPWCHWYTWDIDEVYTELALEDSATSKFGVEGLFGKWDKRNPKGGSYRILIEGDAGYGKSTLVLKIASDWSNSNDYTSRFSLLFVVKLGYVGADGNLLSYLEEFYKEKMDTPLKNVLKSKRAEVLVLLDGYDEANPNTKKEVDRIMKRETMSKCHVVLTSRCGHVPDHVKGHALPVRVTGFGERQVAEAVFKFFIKAGHLTKDQVRNCIDKPVPPRTGFCVWDIIPWYIIAWVNRIIAWVRNPLKAVVYVLDKLDELDDSDFESELYESEKAILPSIDDFKHVQEKDPLLPVDQRLSLEQFNEFMEKLREKSPYKELARCPLLCVMMCCLVSECPNGELPSTVSGLYFAMINRNLYRAARKKAEGTEEVEEQWDLSDLDSWIVEGSENYLQEFGRLCVEGLKTGRMSFTLFDITGQKRAKTTDVKVTQLIEAGVLVQDTNERNPLYQVPHRTTAEFLAAYCFSSETDQNFCQQNLLDLYRLKTSFDEVAASLIEMGKTSCLADAFCDIKFPGDCLTKIPFLRSYFSQHGAAGTWMKFKDALPNKLTIPNTPEKVTVSSAEPNQTLLHLCEWLGKGNTRETNTVSKDCLVSVKVAGIVAEIAFNMELLQTLLKSGVGLDRLDLNASFGTSKSVGEKQNKISEVGCILQKLLKSQYCPVQLRITEHFYDLIPVVTEVMQEVPEGCRLKSFHFSYWGYEEDDLLSLLLEVLADKWLSHLQHLGLEQWKSNSTLKPILKRLREPGCSLTSLYLLRCELIDIEDLMMLASKLEKLSLRYITNLNFDVTEISKCAVKERCSLKSLRLDQVWLSLKGSLQSVDENQELFLACRNVALNLEELTINNCRFPIELFNWLNLSLPNLRTVTIGNIHRGMPFYDQFYARQSYAMQFCASQVLEALTRSSGDSIEELSLLSGFWESTDILMLHPIREALQRCPRMKSVNLGYSRYGFKSIGPGPSTPLSPSDEEALGSDDTHHALLKIVLSVPKLQTLAYEYFFDHSETESEHKWKETGVFHAIADKAEKWPGKTNDNDCNTSLTLHGLSNMNAVNAMHVFRERGLEYRLRYVEEYVYELWFPQD